MPVYHAEIWGHILFWAFLLSMIIYVATGIILAVVVPVLSKKMRLLIPFIYLIYGLLRLVFVEAVASKLLVVRCPTFVTTLEAPKLMKDTLCEA